MLTHTMKGRRLDRYWTPPWAGRVGLWLLEDLDLITKGSMAPLYDPCMGRGDLLRVAGAAGYATAGSDIALSADRAGGLTFEAIEASATSADACQHAADCNTMAVLTNPPYNADTGTAGEVLSAILQWQAPVAALVNSRFTAEATRDRRAILDGTDARPRAILNVGRVEFTGPEMAGDNTPILSQWVVWDPDHTGATTTGWLSPGERARAKGQRSLDFEEVRS